MRQGETSERAEGRGERWCFVHAADLHLDTPFQGLRSSAPEVARSLVDASLDAFDNVVSLAVARGALFVVLAGDIYDGPVRGLRAQIRFRQGLERLDDSGIGTFVVHGNHDPVESGWSAIRAWPPRVRIFPPHAPVVEPVVHEGEQIATVQGVSYPKREVHENLVLRFVRPAGPGPHIGLLHCNVTGPGTAAAAGTAGGTAGSAPWVHANYSPCTLSDLRSVGLDYWALGHVHTRTVFEGGPGEAYVVYPGNTQGRSPAPTERGAKGALVVHVDGRQVAGVEFVACDAVRFADVEVDSATVSDLADLVDLLGRKSLLALEQSDGRSLVLRGRVTGRGPVHRDMQRPGAIGALLAELREGTASGAPFAWWDSLVDATSAPLDLARLRRGGDFAGDLLGLSDRLAADEDLLEQILARCLDDSLPRDLRELAADRAADPEMRSELLALATSMAIDMLDPEGDGQPYQPAAAEGRA